MERAHVPTLLSAFSDTEILLRTEIPVGASLRAICRTLKGRSRGRLLVGAVRTGGKE
jgi:hypothetical protein